MANYFGPLTCCSLRMFVFTIGILFLLVQTAFLIVTFALMRDIEAHVAKLIDWFAERGVALPPPTIDTNGTLSEDSVSYRSYLIKKSGDYLAIPITINVVLIISDTLLIWASAAKNKLLLWPWIILHMLELVFFLGSMIFLMVIVPEPWFKVVIFLVGCPLIVLLAFFWTVVKCLYNYLRDLGIKSAVAAVYQNGYKHKRHVPISNGQSSATMYRTDPGHWDHPVPVWAMRPPPSAWDPDYLQQYDPRFQILDPTRPRPLRSSTGSHLSSRKPTQVLPDGTIVVPIGSEDEEDDIIDINSEKFGSMRSLSDKYQKSHSNLDLDANNLVVVKPPLSDKSSIMSLSDKYRQQEEVEIFHEHYLARPPPEPIRPKKTSSSGRDSDSEESTEIESTDK